MRFVVLGNPDNRRVHFFQDALARHDQPPATVLSWTDFLAGHSLHELLNEETILRIDSPEGEFAADARFLALGAPHMATESGEQLPLSHTEERAYDGSGLRFARQRYLGFVNALHRVQRALDASGAHCTHPPHEVALMSHKARCYWHLREASIPLPPTLGRDDFEGTIDDLLLPGRIDFLLGSLAESNLHGAFVKLWHGSSAAGVAALRYAIYEEEYETHCENDCEDEEDGHKEESGLSLLTSMGFAQDGPFSSLRLREYRQLTDIRRVLSWLYAEGAHTELWLPKLRLNGREFDLRVVTIAGRARQVAVRVSRRESPMTNLHFGNERGDPNDVIELIGRARWDEAMALCERAARCFPGSLCVGFDLMFTEAAASILIEANPFGDLLPGITHEGHTTYEAQVAAILDQYGAEL